MKMSELTVTSAFISKCGCKVTLPRKFLDSVIIFILYIDVSLIVNVHAMWIIKFSLQLSTISINFDKSTIL